LTASRGAELLTWCLADSRARTSPPPARAPESAAPALDSGARWHALLVKFDPDSCGWKTARCLWEEGLDWSCLTLPRWGSLHDGELWERATPGLPTNGRESGSPRFPTPLVGGTGASTHNQISGRFRDAMAKAMALWPTPRASEAGPDFAKLSRSKTGISLQTAVAMWPTPRAANPGSRPNGKGWKILAEEVAIAEGLRERGQTFATPKSRDWKGQSQRGIHAPGDALPNMDRGDGKPVGGSLNPTWVELLMGWPANWSCTEPISHVQYLQWLMENCNDEETRGREVLRVLRCGHAAEEVSRTVGRPVGFREAAVLFADVCQHANRPDQARVFMACAEAPESDVRGVQTSAQASGASHESGHPRQPTGEHPDALQALSRLLAHYGKAAWQDGSWENAVPRVANKVAARVDRLRCTGNGQVPGAAAMAWRILSMHNAANQASNEVR
jgi:DNA (cytosine-5)-methyltransferase 1